MLLIFFFFYVCWFFRFIGQKLNELDMYLHWDKLHNFQSHIKNLLQQILNFVEFATRKIHVQTIGVLPNGFHP